MSPNDTFMAPIALDDPRYYFNRHVQWLEFNRRVLEEARDPGNPLLERVKFLAITANNLDEFVEVRVSSFLQRIEHGSHEIGPDELTAAQELEKVSTAMQTFVRDQYKCWNEELLPAIDKHSIRILPVSELDSKAMKVAKTFYDRRVAPMLTPVTVDPSHPFPHVLNKALCIAFLLRRRRGGNGKNYFGVVAVPRALPRLLRVPAASGGIDYVSLQEIMSTFAPKLYRGYEVVASAPFRIKDPRLCERVCTEILSAYLADTRKARILGADGTYSRPRSIRNGHGFSAQEHLMRLAAGSTDTLRNTILRGSSVVYTPKDATADQTNHQADDAAQDSSNAAV